ARRWTASAWIGRAHGPRGRRGRLDRGRIELGEAIEDEVGQLNRARRRRNAPVRYEHDGHPGCLGRSDAVVRILDDEAAFRGDPQATGRLEVDVRRGLAVLDLVG